MWVWAHSSTGVNWGGSGGHYCSAAVPQGRVIQPEVKVRLLGKRGGQDLRMQRPERMAWSGVGSLEGSGRQHPGPLTTVAAVSRYHLSLELQPQTFYQGPEGWLLGMCFPVSSSLWSTSQRYLAGWEWSWGLGPGWVWAWLWKITSPLQLHRMWKPECLLFSLSLSGQTGVNGPAKVSISQAALDPALEGQQPGSYIMSPLVFALADQCADARPRQQREQCEDRRGLTEVAPKPELSVHKEDGVIYILTTA